MTTSYYQRNKEELLEKKKAYYRDNKEKVLARGRAHLEANREAHRTYQREYYNKHKKPEEKEPSTASPRRKFINHRTNARRRGIEFLFTFEQWMEWWGEDFDRRGRSSDDLCMARYGDVGPYSPENVRKLTVAENHREANLGKTHKK